MSSVLHVSAKTFGTLQGETVWRQVRRTGVSGFFSESLNGRLVDQTTDCFYVTMMPSLVSQFGKAQGLRCQGVAAKEAASLLGEGRSHIDRSALGHCVLFCNFDCSMTAHALEMFSTLPKYVNGFMHDSFELFCFGCSCESLGDDVDVLYLKL